MKRLLLFLSVLALGLSAEGQFAAWTQPILNQQGLPIAGAAVAVCTSLPTTVVPCGGSSLVPLFSGFSGPATTNPLFTDQNGLVSIFASPGNYYIQVYGANIQTYIMPISVGSGTGTAPAINGTCFVDGVIYPTIASARAGCPTGTVSVTSASPAQTLTTSVTFSGGRLVLDAGVTLTIATGGNLIINSGSLDASAATITVTKTSGPGLQLSSGFSTVNLGHLIGPTTGTGIGIEFIGAQFNQVFINEIYNFGGPGILFTPAVADGAARNVTDNSVFVQHVYQNGTGVYFKNGQAGGDFIDEDNHVYAGLVGGNTTQEVQFGDSGTATISQGNYFTGFSDATAGSHGVAIFTNSSYNYFVGQMAPGSLHPSFVCGTGGQLNYILSESAATSDLSGCQWTALSDTILQMNNWSISFESSQYLMRDKSVADAYWMDFFPASGAGGINVFGGANQVAAPVFDVTGGGAYAVGTPSSTNLGQPIVQNSILSAPGDIFVSAWCKSSTSCNPGSGITDESTAIAAIVTAYGAKATMHVIDDMCGIQTWSVNPFNGAGNLVMVGVFEFRSNCAASNPHIVSIDGTSTIGIPGGLWLQGEGTAIGGLTPQYGGTGNTAQGTYIRACNPILYPCPKGGFVQQSGTITGITVSGNLATVTMSGKPFTFSSTALNNIQQYRIIHIVGAVGPASVAVPDNAAWVVSDCNSGGCNASTQTFNLAVPTGFQACLSGNCGTAYLDTPIMAIGAGGGNGVFGAQINNLTVDCSFLPGTIGWVNAIGQELSGVHSVNSYNCTVAGARIDQSIAYNGASFASANSGDYGPLSANTQNATCGNTTCACMGGSGNQITITGFTGTIGTISFTTQPNTFNVGDSVWLSGFTAGNNGLNGSINGALTVLASGLNSTHFQAMVVGSGYSSASGTVQGGGNSCSSFVGGTPGTVVLGTSMSCGAGTGLATISPDPCVNSNFHNFLFTGSAGQQGFGPMSHITATFSDKSASGGSAVPQFTTATTGTTNNYGAGGIVGTTLGCGIGFYGIHGTITDVHHEYARRGICIGGSATSTGTFYYAYTNPTAPATAVPTSGVHIINGFGGAPNSTEVEIGSQASDTAVIGIVNIDGMNMQNGGSLVDIQNNINGETCKSYGTSPGSDYAVNYSWGISTTQANTNAGLTGLATPSRITSCTSLPHFVGNAFAVPMTSTNTIATYGFAVKVDPSNAGQFIVVAHTDGAGKVDGVAYTSTTAGAQSGIVTTGIVPMRFDTINVGSCATIGQFVIIGSVTDGHVQCTGTYTAGTIIGKNLNSVNTTNGIVNVLVGLR